MTLKTSARAALAVSAATLIAALTASPARAGDDGSGSLWDVAKGVLLFGSPSDEAKPVIDYRERAPLVVPKDRTALPAPAQRARRADWPNDPDVAAARAAADEARRPRPTNPGERPRVGPHELAAGRLAGGGGAPNAPTEPGCRTFGGDPSCVIMHPDRLRALGVKAEAKSTTPVGSDPSRDYLTQPPAGYRRVTQSSGGGVARPDVKDDTPNALGFITNPFRKKDDDE